MRSVFSCVSCFIVCGVVGPPMVCRSAEPAPEAASLDKQFVEQLLKIAKEYPSYGRVDDEFRWAPWLCRSPEPSHARFSSSDDGTTHGRKLYFVFAKDREEYLGRKPNTIESSDAAKQNAPHPVGQTIVKESWAPEKVATDTPRKPQFGPPSTAGKLLEPGGSNQYVPFAKHGEDLYRAKDKAGLFIIYKLAEDTPDTDRGWVYGTVSADGKTVTAAGKVQSCIQCHEKASRDRLFGMKYDGL